MVLLLGLWDIIFNTADHIVGLRISVSDCVRLRLEISRLEYSVDTKLISDAEAYEQVNVILDKLSDIEQRLVNVPDHPKLRQKIQKQSYIKVRFDTPVTKV